MNCLACRFVHSAAFSRPLHFRYTGLGPYLWLLPRLKRSQNRFFGFFSKSEIPSEHSQKAHPPHRLGGEILLCFAHQTAIELFRKNFLSFLVLFAGSNGVIRVLSQLFAAILSVAAIPARFASMTLGRSDLVDV